MTARFYWRRAHPVRLPDKVNTKPHQELWEAYRTEKLNKEIEQLIAAELDRDFRRASNGAP